MSTFPLLIGVLYKEEFFFSAKMKFFFKIFYLLETDRGLSHALVHSPDSYNSQGGNRLKPETRNSIQVSRV